MNLRRVVFLDRDGTLVKTYEDRPANNADEIELLPGVAKAVKIFQGLGLTTVVVTNQEGIGLGYMGVDELHRMHDRLNDLLILEGALPIDAFYFCPHSPKDNCECRKPKTKMVRDAVSDLRIDLKDSYLIGDDVRDMELAEAVGISRRYMVVSDRYQESQLPSLIVPGLEDAAKIVKILEENR